MNKNRIIILKKEIVHKINNKSLSGQNKELDLQFVKRRRQKKAHVICKICVRSAAPSDEKEKKNFFFIFFFSLSLCG